MNKVKALWRLVQIVFDTKNIFYCSLFILTFHIIEDIDGFITDRGSDTVAKIYISEINLEMAFISLSLSILIPPEMQQTR